MNTEDRGTAPLPEHIRSLDGLRGLAILMVLFNHFAGGEVDKHLGKTGDVLERFFLKLVVQGGAGVDLFFVLSGFLITRILLRERDSTNMLRRFYARRALRIFPLYYAALFVCLVVLPWLAPVTNAGQAVLTNQHWLWLYLGNVASGFLGVSWRGWPIYLAHTWSLAVEEQFYLLWPFLVLLLSKRRLLMVCLASVPVAILLRAYLLAHGLASAAGTFTLCRIDGLLVGAALAIAASETGRVDRLVPLAVRGLSVTVAAFLALAVFDNRFWWTTAFVHSVYPVFFASILVLVLAARERSALKRVLENRSLTFFGKYSYGIYMNHFILLPALVTWIPVKELERLAGSRILGVLAFGVLASAISVLVALLSWRLLEQPFLKLKRHFEAPRDAQFSGALADPTTIALAVNTTSK